MLNQLFTSVISDNPTMPRNQRNSKKREGKVIKKPRPPGKRMRDINAANVGLRRSQRRTSNAFASNRITANRLTVRRD